MAKLKRAMPIKIRSEVNLPFGEKGIVIGKNPRIWASTYKVKIIKGGIFNNVGDIVLFLEKHVSV